MAHHTTSYSIIIPTFNSEEFLQKTIQKIELESNKLSKLILQEIIIIDDASTDNTWKVITQLKESSTKIKGIRLGRNFGQHNATCAGFSIAKGDIAITLDDDLESNPEDLSRLILKWTETRPMAVIGKFNNINRNNPFKQIFKRIYELLAKLIGGENKVNGSSFRLINGNLAREIAQKATNFVFIDEVLFWHTNSIEFIEVEHQKSLRSKSNYKLTDLFKLGGQVVMYSSLFPIKVVKRLGFFIAFLMFLIGTYFFCKQIFFNVPVRGFTATVVLITFSTGVIIFILGIIGEYLGKIFRNTNNSPVFRIEEEI